MVRKKIRRMGEDGVLALVSSDMLESMSLASTKIFSARIASSSNSSTDAPFLYV